MKIRDVRNANDESTCYYLSNFHVLQVMMMILIFQSRPMLHAWLCESWHENLTQQAKLRYSFVIIGWLHLLPTEFAPQAVVLAGV